jgi:hypothetical protein
MGMEEAMRRTVMPLFGKPVMRVKAGPVRPPLLYGWWRCEYCERASHEDLDGLRCPTCGAERGT